MMIGCPVTGRAIPNGLAVDPTSWETCPIGLNRVSCPECKRVHAWSKGDAHLEGSGGI